MTLGGYNPEYKQLQATLRRMFRDLDTLADARSDAPRGCFGADWTTLNDHSGLAGLAIAESQGGAGFPPSALYIASEEAGRALLAGPLLSSSIIAAGLLETADTAEASKLIQAMAAGERTLTLAWAENASAYAAPARPAATANREDGAYTVSGHFAQVLNARESDVLIVPAVVDGQAQFFTVNRTSTGVSAVARRTVDPTVCLADVTLESAPAKRLGLDYSPEILDRALDRGRIAVAAAQVGASRRCVELSVEYAKTREQFGKPIGSFQAVKHICAQMYAELEAAWATVAQAVASLDNAAEVSRLAPLVSGHVAEIYQYLATQTIHVHGGIGFTWEHDAHLYYKNSLATSALLGTPEQTRALLMQRIGLAEPSVRFRTPRPTSEPAEIAEATV